MEHQDFQIGVEFWSGGKRWRCTDIGTRVIVAISLEPHEVVEIDSHSGLEQRRYETNDASWYNGPPYPIVEHVFDEDGIEDCSMMAEGEGS